MGENIYMTKHMAEDFAKIPELPPQFAKTIEALNAITYRLFYRRKGKKAEYHCTHCGADYQLDGRDFRDGNIDYPGRDDRTKHIIPYEGARDTCFMCGVSAELRARRNWDRDWHYNYLYIWQAIDGGMICRYYQIEKQDFIDSSEKIRISEIARDFYYMNKARFYVARWNYYTKDRDWTTANTYCKGYIGATIGDPSVIYRMTPLKYCPLDKMIEMFRERLYTEDLNSMYRHIFQTYSHFPGIEMEIKAGFNSIAEYHLIRKGVDGSINKRAKRIYDIYKIYPDRMKYLKECKIEDLLLYQKERKCGIRLQDADIAFIKSVFARDEWECMRRYMTIEQFRNRVNDYKNKGEYSTLSESYRHYRDYLNMRQELGYDMTNSVFLHPKSLKKAHDKMVKEKNDRKNELRLKDVNERFADIPKKYRTLSRKYKYEGHGYIIRPAKDAAEIVKEGWAMHHCVGGDNYLRKHNEGRSAILFMRKSDSPDKSYVTIEVQKDKILQWYGAHDKKEVTKAARKCIEEFGTKIAMKKSRKTPEVKEKQRHRLQVAV